MRLLQKSGSMRKLKESNFWKSEVQMREAFWRPGASPGLSGIWSFRIVELVQAELDRKTGHFKGR